jgi:peptide/nickel transport system substrate-binding protein
VPTIDRYIYRVVADGNAALQSVITGESDILVGVPYTAVEPTRQSNPDLNIVDYETVLFNFYHTFQGEGALFADVNIRQALHFALDRQLIADIAYQGFAEPAMGTQPVLSVAYAPDRINTVYNYDPDRARQLLADAGWVDSDGDGIVEKDGQRLSFEMIYSEGVPTYEQQVPYMQQAWREVGMEMIPTQIPFPTLSDQVESGNYQMCLQGFSWSPSGEQYIMFNCDFTPPNGFNRMHYCNPEHDELENAALVELDPAARVELLIEASNIVNDEAAVGVIVFRKEVAANGPRVHNFYPNGYSTTWSVSKVWVDQ